MGMTITQMPCNPGNYTAKRSSAIRYLVVHYTGAPGTARNNGAYFASRGDIGASAHYFVDAQDIVQSVPDGGRAWHCGAASYRHPECRNDNSIGVELCCYPNGDGTWYFDPATVANAIQLIRTLMAKYGIDADHVVRHYDVTGKICPEPYVRDAAAWAEFKARLTAPETTEEEDMVRYNSIDDVPGWARGTIKEMMDEGLIAGTGGGNLDLSTDMVRMFYVMKRMTDANHKTYGRVVDGKVTDVPEWAQDTVQKLVDDGVLVGVGDGKLDMSLDMLRTLLVCQRMIENK